MLDLAIRILAIAACLVGISVCARISEEVLQDHVHEKVQAQMEGMTMPIPRNKPTASRTAISARRPKLTLDTSFAAEEGLLHDDQDATYESLLADLGAKASTILEVLVRRAIPAGPSKRADRLRRRLRPEYYHWAASRTQIHPAIA